MAQPHDASLTQACQPELHEFLAAMSQEQRMLVVLREQLYDGQWTGLVRDLNDRLATGPFVLKLARRIRQDIERINVLRRVEQRFGVDLSDLIDVRVPSPPTTGPVAIGPASQE